MDMLGSKDFEVEYIAQDAPIGSGPYYLDTASQTLRSSRVSAPVVIRVGVVSGTLSGTLSEIIARYMQQNKRVLPI